MHNRQTGLEIITEESSYEFNTYDTKGIVKLEDELAGHLPGWDIFPRSSVLYNSGVEKTQLFERKN